MAGTTSRVQVEAIACKSKRSLTSSANNEASKRRALIVIRQEVSDRPEEDSTERVDCGRGKRTRKRSKEIRKQIVCVLVGLIAGKRDNNKKDNNEKDNNEKDHSRERPMMIVFL